MSENKQRLDKIIKSFSIEEFTSFFRAKSKKYKELNEDYSQFNDDDFEKGLKLGEAGLTDGNILVCAFQAKTSLSERSGKKLQYEKAKSILKSAENQKYSAGIFIFYDENSNFRFSLVYPESMGTKRQWSYFKRFTYFVSKELTNKTFLKRIGDGDFSTLTKIKEAFSVEKVTKEFYQDIANWYFWAINECQFPKDAEAEENGRNIAVIRLITRMIFIWFMRERGLINKKLFEKEEIQNILKNLDNEDSTYYKAILQNLFFATLSTKIKDRQFSSEVRGYKGYNPDFGNQYVYRYQEMFKKPENIKDYFGDVPFLNGGLFECLDDKKNGIIIDGFSRTLKNQPKVPNTLFFGKGQEVDLNKYYGTTNKTHKVRGLLDILSSFNFTIDENSPDDTDIALDPELLGRVFENLLASFNPETSTTARKATGSYYTPREIVDYMVTESLKAYFKTHLSETEIKDINKKLEQLFSNESSDTPFDESESKKLVELIENVKIVDPAVGSGAFPMGALNKMVFILSKIDPENKLWKQAQLKATDAIPDPTAKKMAKERIEEFFEGKNADYGRKLYLIQKCIYGVDIQQIAVEIAKLRFFISLLVDEKIDKEKENWGIEPLPNLDFKIMQGNSLISEFLGIDFDNGKKKTGQEQRGLLFIDEEDNLIKEFEQKKIDFQNEPNKDKKAILKQEVEDLMINIFESKVKEQKSDYFKQIEEIENKYSALPNQKQREEIIAQEKQRLSQKSGFDMENIEKQLREFTSKKKTRPFFPWKLYFAEVFEKGGFDIAIGNPPYRPLQKDTGRLSKLLKNINYETFDSDGDIYCLFYEQGIKLLKNNGILTYITSNKWMRAGYGKKLRSYFLQFSPLRLIDLGPNIFENATVDTNIIVIQKRDNQKKLKALTYTDKNLPLNQAIAEKSITLTNLTSDAWFIGSEEEQKLKEKIEKIGKPLKDWDIKINYGIKTGFNEAFIVDTPTKERLCAEDPKSAEILKPILRGRDIKRYSYDWAGLWLIATFPVLKIDINNYPAVKRHLLGFGQDRLEQNGRDLGDGKKSRKKTGNKWFETQDQIAYYPEFEKEKVIYPNMTKFLPFSYDIQYFFTNQKCFIITGQNLKYLTGFLNSKISYKWIKENCPELQGGTRELSKIFFRNIPIPPITSSNQTFVSQIESLVNQILVITKSTDYLQNKEKQAQVKEYEKQIDQLVYKLYDLTPEEIEIIENSSS